MAKLYFTMKKSALQLAKYIPFHQW